MLIACLVFYRTCFTNIFNYIIIKANEYNTIRVALEKRAY